MGIVLVASPNAIANKPVAAGSSVPEWPAFLASKHHFILLTTAVDDKPSGLSTKSQPSILRPFFLRLFILSIAFDFIFIKKGAHCVHIVKSSI